MAEKIRLSQFNYELPVMDKIVNYTKIMLHYGGSEEIKCFLLWESKNKSRFMPNKPYNTLTIFYRVLEAFLVVLTYLWLDSKLILLCEVYS